MKDLMQLQLPLGGDLMTTVRLTTGGICSLAGMDLDSSEDCKVCVTESLLLLLHAGYARAAVRFFDGEDGLRIEIAGMGTAADAVSAPEDEISEALLGALAARVSFEKRERLTGVIIEF